MTYLDITKCSHCNFPAIYQEFVNILKIDGKCPMCEGEMNPQLLTNIEEPIIYLKSRKVASLELIEKEKKKESTTRLS
jgi:hypothetical protein